MNFSIKSLHALSLNPWVIFGSLGLGFLLGMVVPEFSLKLGIVGDIYVDLMKMIVMPFMVSAVIFSLQRLFQEGGASRVLGRVVLVFTLFAVATALIGALTLQTTQPGASLSQQTLASFGQIIGNDVSSNDVTMTLNGTDPEAKRPGVGDVLLSMVPANIFAALASGDMLKTLVFSLLFGFSIGQVPTRISEGVTRALETVYHSCQTMTHWLNVPLPIILVCMSAAQLAKTGIEPLLAMTQFVLTLVVATLIALVVALLVIVKRSDQGLKGIIDALREPFALALATRSSATCMPSMIESLSEQLGFSRTRVELLVPLSVSLLRIGPILYYVSATLFIAQLYGQSLSVSEVLVAISASILAGFASAGMTGIVTVSLTGMACSYLGLPFEAAFILFVAVDPLCDMLRTLITVIGNSAAVAMICPRPLKI